MFPSANNSLLQWISVSMENQKLLGLTSPQNEDNDEKQTIVGLS